MDNMKIIAEVLSIGLQIGLFSKTEIIDWADQTIEALDSPSIEIIEVSLSSNDKLVDIVPKLKNVKGTYDKKLPVKIILGLLWDKFILNEENVLKIKPFISNLIHNNCCEGFSYVDEQLYNFNEDINLAADNIYGNLEDISQDLKSFLFPYKDFSNYFSFWET
ncbi:hypothetical protein P9W99_25530 [Bacillus cereus]|uniref:Uncharacterized protein n=3 Tax=Bacillus cereus group TaxID=86661 RepID=A0AB36TPD9_BACTU|nr:MULTISPECIES: hypothetical protein [Bacillus]MDJ0282005.1 hypothetical protein [Bacillus bombysepticus]AHZ54630.1 hypothetical protein YBT1520_30614 [Bacillus thuringiensis serovar kurstaki str. YBT-1520]AIE37684.1 hypothetical protein BTK_30434 [Bacillus thuringiensis serovar kurstaki str. HD-1]AIM34958.1 hypothetical protein DF16_pBMB400orf00123 [Bacillus thuringiensis serovar kurstaki str. YBT-1520]AJK37629.1 hypothetical protein BG08_6084 [Bacillus thuringiensis serovar kurstaki]